MYHPESDAFFIAPDTWQDVYAECDESDYLEWFIGKTKFAFSQDTADTGAYACLGMASFLQKYSLPLGFTTMDNDVYWYNGFFGLQRLTLSRYSEYWQIEILDLIYPYIQPYETT